MCLKQVVISYVVLTYSNYVDSYEGPQGPIF